jgi:hypothetical protein
MTGLATDAEPADHCPAVVTIALLLLLFQQGFGFFDLPA